MTLGCSLEEYTEIQNILKLTVFLIIVELVICPAFPVQT
jgi:hypothetical protein